MPSEFPKIVLFDGVCNVCNRAVDFILARDPAGRFQFASLQSPAAGKLLAERGRDPSNLDTIIYIEGDAVYERSTAALRVARRMGGFWPLLYAFIVVPRPLRNVVYRWFAANRYRWFGKRDTCRVPTPEESARFLDGDA